MPIYIYQNPKTSEIIEIRQAINDKHEYIDIEGLKWNRIFTPPELNIDSLNPLASEKEFLQYTKNKKGTIGDLWDKSRELSEKREKVYGKDPVKSAFEKQWSSKRKNKKFKN